MNNHRPVAIAGSIKDYIKKEVRAQIRRAAMARTREDFINRLVEVLLPALAHFYRAKIAILNERTDQVEKWQEHEEAFLDQFRVRIRERTRAKGLDRRVAADKALEEIMDQDEAGRRSELSRLQRTYKLKKVVSLPEDAHEVFIAKVRDILDLMFPD